jgi:hypothetical protein
MQLYSITTVFACQLLPSIHQMPYHCSQAYFIIWSLTTLLLTIFCTALLNYNQLLLLNQQPESPTQLPIINILFVCQLLPRFITVDAVSIGSMTTACSCTTESNQHHLHSAVPTQHCSITSIFPHELLPILVQLPPFSFTWSPTPSFSAAVLNHHHLPPAAPIWLYSTTIILTCQLLLSFT